VLEIDALHLAVQAIASNQHHQVADGRSAKSRLTFADKPIPSHDPLSRQATSVQDHHPAAQLDPSTLDRRPIGQLDPHTDPFPKWKRLLARDFDRAEKHSGGDHPRRNADPLSFSS
jgi:hypothetical protein